MQILEMQIWSQNITRPCESLGGFLFFWLCLSEVPARHACPGCLSIRIEPPGLIEEGSILAVIFARARVFIVTSRIGPSELAGDASTKARRKQPIQPRHVF